MDKLIEEIDNRCNLNDTEMTLLRQTLRILHFPKGSIVIGEGKTDDSIYFLDKGVWRAYIEKANSKPFGLLSPGRPYSLPGDISADILHVTQSVRRVTVLPSK